MAGDPVSRLAEAVIFLDSKAKELREKAIEKSNEIAEAGDKEARNLRLEVQSLVELLIKELEERAEKEEERIRGEAQRRLEAELERVRKEAEAGRERAVEAVLEELESILRG